MAISVTLILLIAGVLSTAPYIVESSGDNNNVFSPCNETTIRRSDGFTFGLAFAARTAFFFNITKNITVQLSPCDSRLVSLTSSNAQLAVFRPKVDEISLLTINSSNFQPESIGGYMVAFAGRKYAATSIPVFVANSTYILTSFTLVMEFQRGRLQSLYWKRDECSSCSGKTDFVCLNNQGCAMKTSSCKHRGGTADCSIGIQLAFSGTDKHETVLNSWYEVKKLRQDTLFGLYENLKESFTIRYNSLF